MKKLLILGTLLLSFLSQANVENLAQLKNIVDEMNYSLAVDWNQEDLAVKEQIMNKFFHQAKELQANGLTKQDMITFLKSEYPAFDIENSIERVTTQFNVNELSDNQLTDLISEDLAKSYDAGANWLAIDARGAVYIILPIGACLSIVIQL